MKELREELVALVEMLIPEHPEEVEDVVQEVLLSLCRAGGAVLNRHAYIRAAARWRCAALCAPGLAPVPVSLDALDGFAQDALDGFAQDLAA